MTWKTLGESLEAALASMLNEVGDEVAGTRLDAVNGSKRGPDAETPGQVVVREETTQPAHGTAASLANGKRLDTAVTSRSPSGAVSRRLALDEVVGRTDCPVNVKRQSASLSPGLTPDGASAHETAPAHRQARRVLRVIEGGRPAGSGGLSRAAYAQARGGNLASNSLRLVR